MKDRDDIQALKDSWRTEFGSAVLKDAAEQRALSGSELEDLRRIPTARSANERTSKNHWPWMALAASLLFLAFWILRPGHTASDASINWEVLKDVNTDLIDRELEQLELEEWAALGMVYVSDHELNLIEEESLEDWLGDQTELLNYIQ
jgi:hypothetical protein